MKFEDFRHQFPLPYFSSDELKFYFQGDYRYHLRYRHKTGKVIKIVNGRYIFSDIPYTQRLRFEVANKIYAPSYISLESALSYYGIIPESVRVTTSITTRKTKEFQTPKGVFLYQSVKPELFHSYKVLTTNDREDYAIATVAKTILDYLYLHHEISSEEDFDALRRDREALREQLFPDQLLRLASHGTNKATQKRIDLFLRYLHA